MVKYDSYLYYSFFFIFSRIPEKISDSDITMIIVTHEMQFAKNVSDKIAFMSDGKIEEYGSPEQVFGSPKSKLTEAFLQNYLKG